MIFKIIGSCIVILSTVLCAFYIEYCDKRRIDDLEEMKKGFNLFSSSMRYTHLPLDEVMKDISKRLSGVSAEVFGKTGDYLFRYTFESSREAWDKSLNEIFPNSRFSNEDIEAFKYFGKTLGYLDYENQESIGRMAIDYIDLTLKSLRERFEKMRKLYRSMGVLSGLLVVIILF